MASTQTSLKTPFKDLTSFKGNMKQLYRERIEDVPIKKRLMAEMNLKRRNLDPLPPLPWTPKVKREAGEEQTQDREVDPGMTRSIEMDSRGEFQVCGAKALDLSPGLKHTLAAFTLSSARSLGGPAAFSARSGHEASSSGPGSYPGMAPLPSPPVLGGIPLLVPSDSSTELSHSLLEGESISCFAVGGEKRLCLPQVLNSVLRHFSLQQINSVCDELYVYCSRCDGEQLHILKVLGILPFNAPSCGLITLTDAQRLCNALLRPGAVLPSEPITKLPGQELLKETEASFQVEHQCLGKCQGLFVPQFYAKPESPCIQCVECQLLFSPQKFVMHSHKSPDKRTCHWGFDSAKWPCYLQLGRKYLGTAEEPQLKQLLEDMKDKFHYNRTSDKKVVEEDGEVRRSSPPEPLASLNSKLADNDAGTKVQGQAQATLVFPHIKEEPSHPSYNLYTYDKMVAPNVSLRDQPEVSSEVLGVLLKHHYSRRLALGHQDTAMDLHASPPAPPAVNDAKSQQRVVSTADRDRQQPVSMETIPSNKSSSAVAMTTSVAAPGSKDVLSSVCEDDKERIVVEIVQMYSRQQEKLHSTLHNQLQLEMELEALRGGEAVRLQQLAAEQCELQSELEAVHTEHAHRLGQVREEQRELEHRLEQLRQQSCVCDNTHQEERYANQLAELRGRLDGAEADRDKLQEELRSERDAREKLERIISQLQQQMGQTASTSASFVTTGSPSPPPTPSSHPPHTEGHTAGPAEQQNGHAHK
ncbi:ski-like protein [Oncorhynchus tshawytscha]|uniref:c-SKI SMAD4-binding domain-containing protein n=1 Tax=Oncorhynchus tshawytscha TaxID=74940 RepID=A0A8C8HY18_ONCTS|nr:ski-like protein [Oncorhynchus tshawytscha]